jgi:hypothetical protein
MEDEPTLLLKVIDLIFQYLPFSIVPVSFLLLITLPILYFLGKRTSWVARTWAIVLTVVPCLLQYMFAWCMVGIQSTYNRSIPAILRHHYDKQLLATWILVGVAVLVYAWGRRRSGAPSLLSRKQTAGVFGCCAIVTLVAVYLLAPYRHLYTAAHQGDLGAMQRALKPWVDPDTLNDWHQTPLYWAAEEHHWAVVDLLLERGADINFEMQYYGSVTGRAAFRGDAEAFFQLVQRGGEPEYCKKLVDIMYTTAELRAIELSNLRVLLDAGISGDDELGYYHYGPWPKLPRPEGKERVTLREYFCEDPASPQCALMRAYAGKQGHPGLGPRGSSGRD